MLSAMSIFSYFNATIPVTKESWSVTMICDSKTSSISLSNHAQLVIEGIKNNGALFRQIIHLTGQTSMQPEVPVAFIGSGHVLGMRRMGQVRIHDVTNKEIHYTHKSVTWVRKSTKVAKMLKAAEIEMENPALNPIPFFICGKGAEWTSKLDTFKISCPFVNFLANSDMKIFIKFYERVQKIVNGTSSGIERLNDPYFYPLEDDNEGGYDIAQKATATIWNKSFKKQVSKERSLEVAALLSKASSEHAIEKLILNASEKEKPFFIGANEQIKKDLMQCQKKISSYFNRYYQKLVQTSSAMPEEIQLRVETLSKEFDCNPLNACQQLMLAIYKHVTQVSLQPHSCFTWACEKLVIIKAFMPTIGIESIVSITKLYLKPVKQSRFTKVMFEMFKSSLPTPISVRLSMAEDSELLEHLHSHFNESSDSSDDSSDNE